MINLRDFVEANLYEDENAVIQDALRVLLRERADLRIGLAIHQYQHGDLSLAKAAHLARVSWAQMRDILHERGVPLKIGPETLEEAKADVGVLRAYFEAET